MPMISDEMSYSNKTHQSRVSPTLTISTQRQHAHADRVRRCDVAAMPS